MYQQLKQEIMKYKVKLKEGHKAKPDQITPMGYLGNGEKEFTYSKGEANKKARMFGGTVEPVIPSETPTFKVSLTFECVDAKNPLEAAKTVLSWLLNKKENSFLGGAERMMYDVVNEETDEAFMVDLSEEDEDAVLPIKD